jgi:plasmid stabilization system protein ParE
MKLAWTPQAIEDLASLRAYIAENNPATARRVTTDILRAISEAIVRHPEIGRPGRVPGMDSVRTIEKHPGIQHKIVAR